MAMRLASLMSCHEWLSMSTIIEGLEDLVESWASQILCIFDMGTVASMTTRQISKAVRQSSKTIQGQEMDTANASVICTFPFVQFLITTL